MVQPAGAEQGVGYWQNTPAAGSWAHTITCVQTPLYCRGGGQVDAVAVRVAAATRTRAAARDSFLSMVRLLLLLSRSLDGVRGSIAKLQWKRMKDGCVCRKIRPPAAAQDQRPPGVELPALPERC